MKTSDACILYAMKLVRMFLFGLVVFVSSTFTNLFAAPWSQVLDLPGEEMNALTVSGDTLWIGGLGRVFRYDAIANSWDSSVSLGADSTPITSIVVTPTFIVAGKLSDGVYVASNINQSWDSASAGLSGLGSRAIADIVLRGDSLYAGTVGAGIFVSRAQLPLLWSLYSNGIPTNISGNTNTLANLNGTLVSSGGQNGDIYLRPSDSQQWREIAYTPFNPLGVTVFSFESFRDTFFLIDNDSWFFSADNGETWNPQNFSGGLGRAAFASLMKKNNRLLSIHTRLTYGTYIFEYLNGTWTELQRDAGIVSIKGVIFHDRIYATRFDGLYYLDMIPTEVDDDLPEADSGDSEFSLDVIYENGTAANGATLVCSAPRPTDATVTVFNALGQQVRSLWRGRLDTSATRIGWDSRNQNGSRVASGIYYIQVATPASQRTVAIPVLR